MFKRSVFLFFACAIMGGSIAASRADDPPFEGGNAGLSAWGVANIFHEIVAVGPGGAVKLKSMPDGAIVPSKAHLPEKPLLLAVGTPLLNANALSKALPEIGQVPVVAVGGEGGFSNGRAIVYRRSEGGGWGFSRIPNIDGGTLYEFKFIDLEGPQAGSPEFIGHASGVDGTLLKTRDGGVTWVKIDTGTKENLWALHFFDEKSGLIGGGDTPWQNNNRSSGIIRRTTDGGKTWKTVLSLTARISDFSFVGRNIGYAGGVGGQLWKTMDGGVTWQQLGGTPLRTIINGISFVTETCGLIVGAGGTAYATTDGGETWPAAFNITNGSFLEDVHPVLHPNRAWLIAAGDGTVGGIPIRAACPGR